MASGALSNPAVAMGALAGAGLAFVALVIVAIVIAIFEATAYPRFARTGSMGEAFNFGAILGHIGKIGWGTYIIALIILGIIWGVVEVVCLAIPFIGIAILLIVIPFLTVFGARYLSLLYDSAGAE